ncbi:MAG TPA: 1,4-dihydroxy-6-naphthoate synthase [Bacteroidales bacterium]|nr:1,4-dihydroxy-6-naphthoate synthase [Bacteroidales bacterium]HXK81814.1 1,4-dihydroxy-6-naphthoate synthase [Bacteroidales bacterium]
MIQNFNLGISPCPNDTFIFYALINNKIDTKGFKFNVVFKDVEQLNYMALEGGLDICKLSYHAFAKASKQYQLLKSGGAFGIKNGPMIVSKSKIYPDEIPYIKIAVPGLNTTAMMLLQLTYPDIKEPEIYVFNEIEDAVLSNQCDAGLLIHESRFTYQNKGLVRVLDLGELWYKNHHLPVPLGGISIKREIDSSIKLLINNLIKKSIDYASKNTEEAIRFAKQYASNMDTNIMLKHIDLYVNEFSLDVSTKGKEAVLFLFESAFANNLISKPLQPIFIE